MLADLLLTLKSKVVLYLLVSLLSSLPIETTVNPSLTLTFSLVTLKLPHFPTDSPYFLLIETVVVPLNTLF
jgi:hypothetical protein